MNKQIDHSKYNYKVDRFNNMNKSIFFVFIIFCMLICACGNDNISIPKPRAYPKVEFVPKETKTMVFESCPFTFDFPSYGTIVKDKPGRGEEELACWFDVSIKEYNAKIHCSYVPIDKKEDLEHYIKDAFTISGQINKRSDYMSEQLIETKNGVKGLMMLFEGPAASPCHFYLTDEKDHYMKASLYFDTQVNPDSLAPITQYLLQDIDQMITSFQWKR